MEELTTSTTLADCEVFALSGAVRIRADDLGDNDTVTLYEQRVDLDYEPAKAGGVQIQLTKTQPSRIVEGYGNYKCFPSRTGLVVGYEG